MQPHTSAGRIPTDKGYRFFVDHLTAPGVLGPTQRRQVAQFFDQVHGEMETVLERATGLLSELTSYAAVVVGPSHETATIRSVQLVGLSSHARACWSWCSPTARWRSGHRPRTVGTPRRRWAERPRSSASTWSGGRCRTPW